MPVWRPSLYQIQCWLIYSQLETNFSEFWIKIPKLFLINCIWTCCMQNACHLVHAQMASPGMVLTHWGRVTHICVSKLTIIGSDNGLSPGRRQAIISTSDGILLIVPLETNFSEILIEILTFSFKKMRLKVSSAKRWPFCLGLNVLT